MKAVGDIRDKNILGAAIKRVDLWQKIQQQMLFHWTTITVKEHLSKEMKACRFKSSEFWGPI